MDHLKELNATIDRMRKVAEGVIEAHPITRHDAATALVVCDSLTQAPDLWDGTLKDLTGYLRMMGALVKGMLSIKEVMPPINNYPGPPLFDVHISQTLYPMGRERKPGIPIYNIFISGDPATKDCGINFSEAVPESARRKFESYDPAVRAVVGACAVVHTTALLDGDKSKTDFAGRLLTLAINKLVGDEIEMARTQGRGTYSSAQGLAKCASLQKAIKDKLGVTPEELNVEDVLFFCHWRVAAAMLGIDNYFVEGELSPIREQRGAPALKTPTLMRPEYLPTQFDLALHMGSQPNLYTPEKPLDVALGGLATNVRGANRWGRPWIQLQVVWIAAKAVIAGAPLMPSSRQRTALPDNHVYCFTPAQLRPQVEAAEELLERMRPWLGDVAAFRKVEKDVKGWRKKYITGKDQSLSFAAVPMGCITSQWVVRDGDGEKKSHTCANCENSSDKLKVCSACKQAWYCDAVCQKAGWKAHKKACIASRKNA